MNELMNCMLNAVKVMWGAEKAKSVYYLLDNKKVLVTFSRALLGVLESIDCSVYVILSPVDSGSSWPQIHEYTVVFIGIIVIHHQRWRIMVMDYQL